MDFYAAHRTELQAAQATLQDFAEANDDSMLIRPVEALGKDYQNEGVCVKRVNELYFISRKGEYAAEVYQSIYESVLPLFRDIVLRRHGEHDAAADEFGQVRSLELVDLLRQVDRQVVLGAGLLQQLIPLLIR